MSEENQQELTNPLVTIPVSELVEEKTQRAKKRLRPGGKNIREV